MTIRYMICEELHQRSWREEVGFTNKHEHQDLDGLPERKRRGWALRDGSWTIPSKLGMRPLMERVLSRRDIGGLISQS